MRAPTTAILTLFPSITLSLVLSASAPNQTPAPPSTGPRVVILDLDGDGFPLTTVSGGVRFDMDADGTAEQTAWTTAGVDDAFVVLDSNGNGAVDSGSEVVSTSMRLPQAKGPITYGPRALAILEGYEFGPDNPPPSPIPPGVGKLDKDDEVFARLRVWVDRNHDGKSAGEVRTLTEAGIVEIFLGYMRRNLADANGNTTLLTGFFFVQPRGVRVQRPLIDVRLAR